MTWIFGNHGACWIMGLAECWEASANIRQLARHVVEETVAAEKQAPSTKRQP
ncbi:hypothetical protein PGT21_008546 [Puccinia graminis f. sp. tritici]|uniref:Uncharacterized protein n=1 Tax=Puccinia graminis f. sp. tritici TaxID=56615 RepID=A0A5B0M3J6_PUCGR|nr:hypothetical protein PGT21_008443 [Puccinia graminis f. sp. tritici]KAA1086690.1 hypothetical protein PGT21_008546 [Puccinia graminis f. sp. tritici]KAA1090079.1 hypothetical protein PGTUg99_035242 [Puccinia graminis f. sp. tritici]KAA1130590.1 hypothetical protein PGTUg99_004450 [Puccinia graminis f. sp. tritici]